MAKNDGKSLFVAFNKVKNYIVSVALAAIFGRNASYYYLDCNGTLNPVALFIKNLVSPGRFLTKVRFGQIPALKIFSKSQPMVRVARSEEFLKKLSAKTDEFRTNGVVVFEGYFKALVRELEQRYGVQQNYFDGTNMSYVSKRFDIRKEDLIAKVALDPMVLSVIGGYFNCQPCLRTNPHMTASRPELNFQDFIKDKVALFVKDEKNGNMNWHFDTANLVSMIILLNEGNADSTHMLYAKKSHRNHYKELRSKFDYFYSEEIVRDHFEILPCVYPKGTAIIFDTNGLHRMNPIKNTFRSLLHVLYTPGNDRFWQMPAPAQAGIKTLVPLDQIQAPDLTQLDALQKAAIEGLFPLDEKTPEPELQKVAVG